MPKAGKPLELYIRTIAITKKPVRMDMDTVVANNVRSVRRDGIDVVIVHDSRDEGSIILVRHKAS
jgi:hypothetical protein